jgi:type I restriction enzyme S subunit
MKEVTLSKIIGDTGVFVDGDWVESKDQDVNGDVRLIQLADIGDGVFINKSNRFLTSEKAKELKCTFLKQGDLLIARMPDPLGRACIFPGLDMPCVTVVDVCIVRPDANIANSYWLKFLINSYDFRNKINKYITGTTRQRISRGNLEKLSFNLPELSEQLKIISVLSKAEKLITERKASIDLLDVFLKSTFLKMFGDPLKNEKGWEKVKLSDVCRKIGSGSTPRGGKESYHKEGISLIRSLNVHIDEFSYENLAFIDDLQADELSNVVVEENDVLLNITGASVARCCIVPKNILPARVSQHVSIIRPDSKVLNPIFLSKMITNGTFQSYLIKKSKSKGATREAITKDEIELLQVVAPSIKLQDQFAEIVEKAELLKGLFKDSLDDLENLYSSVSQKAFKGELDLSTLALKYEVGYSSLDNDREEPKPIDKEKITIEVKKEEKPEYKRYEVPFEVDEATAEKQGKEFYKEWKKLHPKKRKSKLTWDRVSTEQAANWIKVNYAGFHFTSEMLVRFLIDEHVTFPDYYSSEELKKNPQANEADDLKSLIFSAVSKENPFLKLEQVFYNGVEENFQLKITEADYEHIKELSPKERSGIYFSIIE